MRGHLSSVLDSLLFATEEKAIEEARRAAAGELRPLPSRQRDHPRLRRRRPAAAQAVRGDDRGAAGASDVHRRAPDRRVARRIGAGIGQRRHDGAGQRVQPVRPVEGDDANTTLVVDQDFFAHLPPSSQCRAIICAALSARSRGTSGYIGSGFSLDGSAMVAVARTDSSPRWLTNFTATSTKFWPLS